MAKVANITAAEFDTEVAGRKGLVLVDLWGPNCAPCRALAPILDDLAEDFGGEVAICKIDVEAEQDMMVRLGARAMPTLALFHDGTEVDRIVGICTRSRLTAWLESHL
ncbi:thioredoxin domain-containing protein [uncultured Sphingomonas sp.]|uniref:thioredoxin family protein n=1 Tax=uncultured Sphingomonas sp. TaxID=158754 RepID=UPI002625F653|nr:thioredoxin domain-containing protein [uncultured Sphingomonas sp.]